MACAVEVPKGLGGGGGGGKRMEEAIAHRADDHHADILYACSITARDESAKNKADPALKLCRIAFYNIGSHQSVVRRSSHLISQYSVLNAHLSPLSCLSEPSMPAV